MKKLLNLVVVSSFLITGVAMASGRGDGPGSSAKNLANKPVAQTKYWFSQLECEHEVARNNWNADKNLAKFASQSLSDVLGDLTPTKTQILATTCTGALGQYPSTKTFSNLVDEGTTWPIELLLASVMETTVDLDDSFEKFTSKKTSDVFADQSEQDAVVSQLFDKNTGIYPASDFNLDVLAAAFKQDAAPGSDTTILQTIKKIAPGAQWAN